MLIHHMILIIYFKFIYDVLLLHLFRCMCLSYSTLLPFTQLIYRANQWRYTEISMINDTSTCFDLSSLNF